MFTLQVEVSKLFALQRTHSAPYLLSLTVGEAVISDRLIEDYILFLDPLLYVTFNISDRSYVVVPSPKCVVGHEEGEDACPYHAAPIHFARRRAWSSREELKYPEYYEEAQRYYVDCVASLAKAESRSWEPVAAKSLLEDTCDL